MKKDLYKSGADIKALEVVIAARKESVNNDKNKAIFSMSIPWEKMPRSQRYGDGSGLDR